MGPNLGSVRESVAPRVSEKARIDFRGWRNDLSAWVRQQREVRLDQVDQDFK